VDKVEHRFTACGKNRLGVASEVTDVHSELGYIREMRGNDEQQGVVFSYVNIEDRIPAQHPLRSMRRWVDVSLGELSVHFAALYSRRGRPSIAPERRLRALLLMVLYSIRSERQLMEHIQFNELYRWFVGLNRDDEVWNTTVFTKNRERLMSGEVTQRLLEAVVEQARGQGLLSEEHFTVDGTLLQAWASRRSFRAKQPPPSSGTGAGGRLCLRDTHESTSDAEARLFKRNGAVAALPSYLGHVLTENRHGLVVAACVTQSSTQAERAAGLAMLARIRRDQRITLGADNAYQERDFIEGLRARGVVPHVAECPPGYRRPSYLTAAERETEGFRLSQRARKLVEKVFGWGKQARPMKQVKLRGQRRVDWLFRLVVTAQNLLRLHKLIPAQ
jgi:transposase